VVLGRSQDLFTYKQVGVVRLVTAENAYFEHALAPYKMAVQTGQGYVVLMPRFLDYDRGRLPTFARYVVLHRRVHSEELLKYEGAERELYWVDPESPEEKSARLGLFLHTFVGEYDDQPLVAGMAR
jgi:CRISPR-associated protein Cas5t